MHAKQPAALDSRQRERYSRQILFPPIGERGQERLLRAHAAIVGCGALGSFHAGALARAGVWRLTIVDRDYVEPSNLHRQLLLDGTDNFETRYLINDFAVSRGIPWIYGAAVASYGLTMPVIPGHTACLRCVYPEPPSGAQPTCETTGVLNALTAAIASFQVADAMKILSGRCDAVVPRITTIDIWSG